jgi:hypothetical protein
MHSETRCLRHQSSCQSKSNTQASFTDSGMQSYHQATWPHLHNKQPAGALDLGAVVLCPALDVSASGAHDVANGSARRSCDRSNHSNMVANDCVWLRTEHRRQAFRLRCVSEGAELCQRQSKAWQQGRDGWELATLSPTRLTDDESSSEEGDAQHDAPAESIIIKKINVASAASSIPDQQRTHCSICLNTLCQSTTCITVFDTSLTLSQWGQQR